MYYCHVVYGLLQNEAAVSSSNTFFQAVESLCMLVSKESIASLLLHETADETIILSPVKELDHTLLLPHRRTLCLSFSGFLR